MIETLDAHAPSKSLLLKWPNDVLMNGAKLAGILLERSGNRVVIGFGVNLAFAPELPDRLCASLSGNITIEQFAPLLQDAFSRLLGLWRQSEPLLLARAWLARAHPVGTALSVHSSKDDVLAGQFDGIEVDGALRLRMEGGAIEIVRAGDVQL